MILFFFISRALKANKKMSPKINHNKILLFESCIILCMPSISVVTFINNNTALINQISLFDIVTGQKFSFFSRRKKAIDFFLENGRYKPNEQISKEKKQVIGRKRDFCPFFRFFCFQKWRFYVHWYILCLNSQSYDILKGTFNLKTFQDKHFFNYATIMRFP